MRAAFPFIRSLVQVLMTVGLIYLSWILTDLCMKRLHRKFGIHENPVHSEKRLYPTPAPECVYIYPLAH